MSRLFTLIIPTYNRPEYLLRNLSLLEKNNFKHLIIVADSSSDENQDQNKKNIQKINLEIIHKQYDETINGQEKWLDALNSVQTDYVALCADDDLILPYGIDDSVEFLQNNKDYVACQGISVNFTEHNNNIFINDIEYLLDNTNQEDPLERITSFFTYYEANCYSVFKTPILKKILSTAVDFKTLFFWEIYFCVYPLIQGKIKRLPSIHSLRNASSPVSAINKYWQPDEWVVDEFDFFMEQYSLFHEKIKKICCEKLDLELNEKIAVKLHSAFLNYLAGPLKNRTCPNLDLSLCYAELKKRTVKEKIIYSDPLWKKTLREYGRKWKNKFVKLINSGVFIFNIVLSKNKNNVYVNPVVKKILSKKDSERFAQTMKNYYHELKFKKLVIK